MRNQASVGQLAAVILAGGFGTRIKSLLDGRPKAMAPVCGRPFIDWIIQWLLGNGVSNIVVSTGYLADAISAHLETIPFGKDKITCVRETDPLGTAGGFIHSAQSSGLSPNVWLVVNGDTLAISKLATLVEPIESGQWEAVIQGIQVPDAKRYGSIKTSDARRLVSFMEKAPGPGVVNAGVYAFSPDILKKFPKERPLSFEHEVFPYLIRTGRSVGVVSSTIPFIDIGTPETLREASDFVARHFSGPNNTAILPRT